MGRRNLAPSKATKETSEVLQTSEVFILGSYRYSVIGVWDAGRPVPRSFFLRDVLDNEPAMLAAMAVSMWGSELPRPTSWMGDSWS